MKDVEFTRREIVVREGKGNKDRVTMLPDSLADRLRAQMAFVKGQHMQDLAVGLGEVWLPDALALKYPNAAKALAWQYVFPAAGFSARSASGAVRRHHVDEKRVQRAVKRAVSGRHWQTGHARIRCAIHSPRICWKAATTSARCRNCWGTRMCRRR